MLDDEIILCISFEEILFDKVAVLLRAVRGLEVYVEPRLRVLGSHIGGSRIIIFNFPSLALVVPRWKLELGGGMELYFSRSWHDRRKRSDDDGATRFLQAYLSYQAVQHLPFWDIIIVCSTDAVTRTDHSWNIRGAGHHIVVKEGSLGSPESVRVMLSITLGKTVPRATLVLNVVEPYLKLNLVAGVTRFGQGSEITLSSGLGDGQVLRTSKLRPPCGERGVLVGGGSGENGRTLTSNLKLVPSSLSI